MIKKVIVGVNSTGKSEYLQKEFDEENEEKKLFLPTEMILDEEVKSSNKAKGTFVIDNIIPIIFEKIGIDMGEKKENLNTDITKSIEKLDNPIVNKFMFNNKWNYEKILENNIKKEFNVLGSGDKSKYVLEMIDDLELNNYKIYIDEPEKFAHPSLQVEIANIINNLAINNDIYLVSHSPIIVKNLNINNLEDILVFKTSGEKKLSDNKLKDILSSIDDMDQNKLFEKDSNKFNDIKQCTDFLNLTYNEFKEYYFLDLYKQLIFYSNVIFTEDINTKFYIEEILTVNNNKSEVLEVAGKVPLLIWAEISDVLEINYSLIYDNDKRLEYDEKKEFTGKLQDPIPEHKYYNEKLQNLNSQEVTVDIEHSVLGYEKYIYTNQNKILKEDMKNINRRKVRIDTRLKLKKCAQNRQGFDFEKLENFISSCSP